MEMFFMRRAAILSFAALIATAPVFASDDQSGRVRRVNRPAPPPASAPDTTAAATPDASATPQPQEKIAVNVKCDARYDGGSLNLERNQKLTVTVKDGILSLNTRGSSFEIPTSQVTELSYSQKSRNRTAEGIGAGAVNRTAGVLLGNSRTTSHYLTIQWVGSPPGGVSLRVDKNDIRGVLAALEAATGIRSRTEGRSWN
jgi:hypothetical protein